MFSITPYPVKQPMPTGNNVTINVKNVPGKIKKKTLKNVKTWQE